MSAKQNATPETRHPQSEMLDLIHRYCGNHSAEAIFSELNRFTVKEWQLSAPPGSYVVQICESQYEDTWVGYSQIVEADEKFRDEFTKGSFARSYARPIVFLNDNTAKGTPLQVEESYPHHWKYLLSPEEFAHLKAAGLPERHEDFIRSLCDFHFHRGMADAAQATQPKAA